MKREEFNMLYPQSRQPYDDASFHDPCAIYRGAPFWAWNCDMNEQDVDFMMDMFHEMGMGGAHLHSRTGMALPYLQRDFMRMIRRASDCAREKNMYAWLYDEDRWPSGYGGGYITQDDRYRARVLILSPEPLGDIERQDTRKMVANGKCARSNNRRLMAIYSVDLDEDGWLEDYQRLETAENADPNTLWYAYLEISGNNPWFNNQSYANNLDPESVKRFIEITYDAYAREVGEAFGKSIPAIFTDEPQFSFKNNLRNSGVREPVSIPFTDDLPETYQAAYGEDLMAHLPEIFFDRKDSYPATRYRYHDHVTERFASAYSDQIGAWCEGHGIAFTGHVMHEPTLHSQTCAVGEAMRFYRSMQIPGIDMLAYRTEYNTAKQCQSAVHQYGREAMLDELYGVTNWDFEFRGHKLLGDWQAALGVTVRVPHLSWTSMAGEAKRDYPASIGYQSPWYKEYNRMETYFARIATAMTRGKCDVHLAVLHPIESYWLTFGTEEKTGRLRKELNDAFDQLTGWLIGDTKDFDFIAESLVHPLFKGAKDGCVQIGEMRYSTILAPNMLTLRSETLAMLKAFRQAGGRIIFAGYTPTYLDGILNDDVSAFAATCEWVPMAKNQLLSALDGVSDLDIFQSNGMRTGNLLTQMRVDGDEKWLFVAHKPPLEHVDYVNSQPITLRLRGLWNARLYDAWNNSIRELPARHKDGYTFIEAALYAQDSLLVRFTPASDVSGNIPPLAAPRKIRPVSFDREVPVTLSEPNVLLLDMAEYAFDDGEWQPREEILRLDNRFRDALHLPYRMEAFPQPWVLAGTAEPQHTLRLRFTLHSEIDVDNVELALEHPQTCSIFLGRKKISTTPVGRYVDRDIFRVALGQLPAGESELIVTMPFEEKTDAEAMYLLGDFGVRVSGDRAVIIPPVRRMTFSDWTTQGLPFYGGAVTYHIDVEGSGKLMNVELTKFRAPVTAVDLDGKRQGIIALSPYCVTTEPVEDGTHRLDLTVFGNRFNTFGALHHTDAGQHVYCSPNFWRSTGSNWAYEYQLRPTGPLKSPEISEIFD